MRQFVCGLLLDIRLHFSYILPTESKYVLFKGGDPADLRVVPAGDPWLNPATV
jgi:hypothetical protein